MTHREIVEAVWEKVAVYHDSTSTALDLRPDSGEVSESEWDIERKTPNAAWQAASAFTLQRLEEVRQLDEEIYWLDNRTDYSVPLRILARLCAIRSGLTRGIRPEALEPERMKELMKGA